MMAPAALRRFVAGVFNQTCARTADLEFYEISKQDMMPSCYN
jgi:hypothetical protein